MEARRLQSVLTTSPPCLLPHSRVRASKQGQRENRWIRRLTGDRCLKRLMSSLTPPRFPARLSLTPPSLQLCSCTHFHSQQSSPRSIYQCLSTPLIALRSTYLSFPTLSPSISLTLRSLTLCSGQTFALLWGLLHPSYFQSVLGLAHGSTSCFSGTGSFEHLNTLEHLNTPEQRRVWGPPLPLFGSHTPFCTRYVEWYYTKRDRVGNKERTNDIS